MVYDGSDSIFCRMFNNLPDVIKGFSRYIYAAFDCNFLMEAIAIFFISLIFMILFILLPLGIFVFDWSARMITLCIVQILLIFFIKVVCAIRFKERNQDIFFTPISVAYIALLAVNSFFQSRFGKGVNWKDRTYDAFTESGLGSIENKSKKHSIP